MSATALQGWEKWARSLPASPPSCCPQHTGAASASSSRSTTTNKSACRVNLRDYGVKGRGLYVTERIAAGDIIFSDAPTSVQFVEFATEADEFVEIFTKFAEASSGVSSNQQKKALLCDECLAPLLTPLEQMQLIASKANIDASAVKSIYSSSIEKALGFTEPVIPLASLPATSLTPSSISNSTSTSAPTTEEATSTATSTQSEATQNSSLFTQIMPVAHCSQRCLDVALRAHLALLAPHAQTSLPSPASPSTSTSSTLSIPSVTPAVAHAVADAVTHFASQFASLQWPSGFRALKLFARVVGRVHTITRNKLLARTATQTQERPSTASSSSVDDERFAHWWLHIDASAWEEALRDMDSFSRPPYASEASGSEEKGGVKEGTKTSSSHPEEKKRLSKETSATNPDADADADADTANDETNNAISTEEDIVRLLVSTLSRIVDARWPRLASATVQETSTETCAVPAASTLLVPFELVNRLVGVIVTNVMSVGSIPSVGLYAHHFLAEKAFPPLKMMAARNAAPMLQAFVKLSDALSGADTLLALPHFGGMMPWHACLNHCCRPNAEVSASPDFMQTLLRIPTPATRAAASRVYVRALRDIEKGEEITISYIGDLVPSAQQVAEALQHKQQLRQLPKMRAMKKANTEEAGAGESMTWPQLLECEAALADAIQERFGWKCSCQVCEARPKKTSKSAT